MKNFISAFLLLSSISLTAGAQDLTQLDGVDLKLAVAHFSKQVVKLERPVSVYHWGTDGKDDFWKTDRASDDPLVLKKLSNWSRSFWIDYGKNPSGSMYGTGLYAAVDPVATRDYGSMGNDSWLLLETHLPTGFRIIDIPMLSASGVTNIEIKSTLEAFECPSHSTDVFFSEGGRGLTPKCQRFSRRMFKEILKIDGFAYWYGEGSFDSCAKNRTLSAKAFVLIQPGRLNATNSKFYTTRTRQFTEDRLRIQSLFLKDSESTMRLSDSIREKITTILYENANLSFKRSKSQCLDSTCTLTAFFCDDQEKCIELEVARVSPGKITSDRLKNSLSHPIMWEDLVGLDQYMDLTAWLRQNKLGCDGKLHYAREAL